MRPPDAIDATGTIRIWRINPAHAKTRPDHEASLGVWVVNGPFHVAWQWWLVNLISLRDLEGVPPANKHYPEAEYEFSILSLNPDRGTPDIDAMERGEQWGEEGVPLILTPPDVVKQFHGVTESQAIRLAEDAMGAITAGYLSPDSDYRSRWESAIDTTVEHIRAGYHHEQIH